MVNIGVIGYGYWGPNIVRNFYGLTDCKIVAVCDKSPEALQHVLASYSGIECTRDAQGYFYVESHRCRRHRYASVHAL